MDSVLNNLKNAFDKEFFIDTLNYSAVMGLIGGALCIFNPPLIPIVLLTTTTIQAIYQVAFRAIMRGFNIQDKTARIITAVVTYLSVGTLVAAAFLLLGSPVGIESSILVIVIPALIALGFLIK